MTLAIDHSAIDAGHLAIELANAAHDPDGQVYPWRDNYPLSGQSVYWSGAFWVVTDKEHPLNDSSFVRLVEVGGDKVAVAARYELRPVTWSQHNEDWLGRE